MQVSEFRVRQGESAMCLLPTALVSIYMDETHIGTYRALCDTGAHVNVVNHRLVESFYEQGEKMSGTIGGISNEIIQVQRKITLTVQPWFDSLSETRFTAEFRILPESSDWSPIIPPESIPYEEMSYELKPKLADPMFWKAQPVFLILSVEFWGKFITERTYALSQSLSCHESKFGTIILGKTSTGDNSSNLGQICAIQGREIEELEKTLQRFWEFENLSLCNAKDAEADLAEQIFENEHSRDEQGRMRRFFMLEKRFERDESFKTKYIEFMRDYIETGHMSPVQAEQASHSEKWIYHIPHHGVTTSKKFRVVFDASCKTDKGISLNDAQLIGGKLQRDLHETTMRFRRHKCAINADIKQMFRQIKFQKEHWDLQRIFWRENSREQLKEYWLKVVTYGLGSSPHCATRALIEGAIAEQGEFPEAAEVIFSDFYMDDLLTGAENVEQAFELANQIVNILAQFGMVLCKWQSNDSLFTRELLGESASSVLIQEQEKTSVLELKWLTRTDEFTYEVTCDEIPSKLTKRIILSKIGQLYDPKGFIAPVIVCAKMLMQKLWQSNLDWDLAVSQELKSEWNLIWNQIKCLEQIRIPRWLNTTKSSKMELHGFCDASAKAYGAVIYVRVERENEQAQMYLLISKSRVAPIKSVTIPRLKLAAADLLSQLYELWNGRMFHINCGAIQQLCYNGYIKSRIR